MKQTRLIKLTAVSLAAVLSAGGLPAQVTELVPLAPQSAEPAAGPVDETPTLWFVELSGNPLADGGNPGQLRAEKQAFRNAAAQAALRFSERYAYDNLWNGLSVSISPAEIGKLSRLPGVKALYPVEVISRPTPGTTSLPDLQTAIDMTGANIAQGTLGLTGAGVKVAVMDTGIDIDHPDLGGTGTNGTTPFPSARVTHGYDFVGDAFNADPTSPGYNPVPVPDPNPDDCNGHGTHVAGIIGANGLTKGVAPGVTFGAYRVFGCEGSTTGDIMLAAMERALADGMHVLNMSIGSAFQWPQYPTAQAADRLVNKGVVVVASTGNSGASGLYAAGAPGLGKKVIAVASVDNTHVRLSTFTASPDGTEIGYAPATGAPLPPTSGSLVLARTGTPGTPNDACAALPAGSLAGKAVLIRRGTCSFHIKALNAQNAGAAAVILYNNSAGRFSPTVAGTPAITIPVVAISDAEGIQLNNLIVSNPPDTVTITWTAGSMTIANPTGGLISSFSSYGLSPDLELKPDIAAPGGLISSTYPLESGGYATISGTSMAAPHVAGGVALLLQAKPKTSVQNVRTILQNSADPKAWWGNPALGFLDNVHRQGAGVVDIDDAILATTVVSPGKISLGESEGGPKTVTLTVSNNASTPVVYDLTSVNALSTGSNNNLVSFHSGTATVSFAAPTLAVPANSSASVSVTITAPATPVNGTYGGYLVLTPQGGGQVYRVPFAGHIGDYQALQVLVPTANAFPWLAKPVGTSYSKQNAGTSFTMVGNDIPFVLVHLEHQSRKLRIEVIDAVTGRNWHRALDEDYLPRNSTATGFFALPFDGVTVNGNRSVIVPNGNYVLKLSVLKALGDDNNPAHWETWTSPAFVIARP